MDAMIQMIQRMWEAQGPNSLRFNLQDPGLW